MAEARRTIVKPVVTEKSIAQTAGAQYTFAVSFEASKHTIAEAIEKLFKVKVLRVNTVSGSKASTSTTCAVARAGRR